MNKMPFAFYSLQVQSSQRNKLFCRLFKNWNIIDLQCCANLCCIAKWLIYIPIDILIFIFFSIVVYHRILNVVLCYMFGPCWLSVLNVLIIACIYQPQAPSPPLSLPRSPLATTSLVSVSMSLFLFCRQVYLCHILDSTCQWYYRVFVFLFLTYFSSDDTPLVHPCCCK